MNELSKNIENEEWYGALVEECKAIITEAVFTSRWALVQGYWELGQRIRKDSDFGKFSKGSYSSLQDLGKNIGTSTSTLYYALQAYDKYSSLDQIPEGKNISWNKLITKYLPRPKEEVLELPEGEFNVILADPPWCYSDKENTPLLGGAEKHYNSMTIEELCALKLPVVDNSVLFLWVTSPLLDECFEVIRSWGFEYKTSFVWDKVSHNMGHYNSVRHEFLLVCTRGSMTPEVPTLFDSVITEEKSGVHSQKPTKFYEIIETLYPNGKYLELFARNKRDRWCSWGNEI